MKPNNDSKFADWKAELPKTHNRVAAFEKQQKLRKNADSLPQGNDSTSPEVVSNENPYFQARLKVLNGYKEDRRIEILAMERDGNIDNRFYAAFIADVVVAAGDVPSLAIRNFIKGC